MTKEKRKEGRDLIKENYKSEFYSSKEKNLRWV